MPRGGPRPNSGGARPGAGRKPKAQLDEYNALIIEVYGGRLREILEAKVALALDPRGNALARVKAMDAIEQRLVGSIPAAHKEASLDNGEGASSSKLEIVITQEEFDAL